LEYCRHRLQLSSLPTQAADTEINTPAIASLKQSMQQRHGQLEAYYMRGAIGLARDGLIALWGANALPLAARQSVDALIASENEDRNALYREIARANDHPNGKQISAPLSVSVVSIWRGQAGGIRRRMAPGSGNNLKVAYLVETPIA
jgi:hypothetical protein